MSRIIATVAFAVTLPHLVVTLDANEHQSEVVNVQAETTKHNEQPPSPEARFQNAEVEYAVRFREFKDRRSPAEIAIRSNQRLLLAALMLNRSNAATEYDRRAATIESHAKINLERRTGTDRDVALAASARLPALLKHYFEMIELDTN